eukprot:2392407-Pleurochrysis_carterae.AAC.1
MVRVLSVDRGLGGTRRSSGGNVRRGSGNRQRVRAGVLGVACGRALIALARAERASRIVS